MEDKNGLTLKEVRELSNCPAYVVRYLSDCGRLPIVKKSPGRGYPTLYHPDTVQIVKDHISRYADPQ